MIVLSYGMAKSASSYVFQITQKLCEKKCKNLDIKLLNMNDLHVDYDNPNFLHGDYALDDLVDNAHKLLQNYPNSIFLVKTHHECTPYVRDKINDGSVIATATFRHPQELALSITDATKSDKKKGLFRFKYGKIEDTIPIIRMSIDRFNSWKEADNTLCLLYDEIAITPNNVAEKIADKLGLSISSNEITQLFEEDKSGKIWEFNKGVVNRHLHEFPRKHKKRFNGEFSEFSAYVDGLKKQIN